MLLPSPKQNTTPTNEAILHVGHTSYVSPDIPLIDIQNTTPASISIDTCRDFVIKKDHNLITNPPNGFCKSLNIGA
jgi:hypothetical protein